MHFASRLTALAVLVSASCAGLSACGNKGQLTLPPKETLAKPAPSATATATAKPAAADHNSTTTPSAQ